MKTLQRYLAQPPQIPLATVWLLNDLAEYRGKQDLFTKQSPQKLARLCENAIIESAVASNRIEGVEIDRKRVGIVVFGKGVLSDRNEQEVRGYQAALAWIHREADGLPLTVPTALRLHALSHPDAYDTGRFKEHDGEIIEKHADGRVTVRFKPLSAAETPAAMEETFRLFDRLIKERNVPPLVLWAAMNLDFLCIHPFRDGNGRVSRLLLLLSLYHQGFAAGRYVSVERIIEQSKDRYYESLRQSSQSWHEGRHDPWPYTNYLLFTLKDLYAEFERRVGDMTAPKGEKAQLVLDAIQRQTSPFRLADIEQACPGVGRDWIQTILTEMKDNGELACTGKGPAARWQLVPKGEGSTPK
jgi:Fic family protein